jgi:hypothetical protein
MSGLGDIQAGKPKLKALAGMRKRGVYWTYILSGGFNRDILVKFCETDEEIVEARRSRRSKRKKQSRHDSFGRPFHICAPTSMTVPGGVSRRGLAVRWE